MNHDRLVKLWNDRGVARRLIKVSLLASLVQSCTLYGQHAQSNEQRFSDSFFDPVDTETGEIRHGPLIALPGSGQIKSLKNDQFGNGMRQRITFESRNSFTRVDIKVITDSARRGGGLDIEKPRRSGIDEELSRVSDSGPYQIVTRSMHNKYGPFGAAIIGSCIYAWQWIDDIREYSPRLDVHSASAEPASLRIQHCHKTSGSTDALIADVERLSLLSGTGGGVRSRKRVTTEPVSRQPSESQRYVVPQGGPPVGGVVPRPSADGDGGTMAPRHFLTETPAAASDRRDSDVASPAAGQGQIYTPPSLSPDIPARAYQGPNPPPDGW